jgi:hypothetical protein
MRSHPCPCTVMVFVEMKEKIGVLENVVGALSVQENLVLGWTVGVSFCGAHVEA